MTKLTTERLEQYAHDKHMCNINDEIREMARQLLAYEQAAKNPVAFVDERGGAAGGICWAKSGKRELPHGTELYAAPVLLKQPDGTLTNEGAKIIKAAEKLVRCKGRYHSEQNYRALAALFGVTVPDLPPLPSDEAPIQPESEIPFGDVEPIEVTDDMVYAFHNRLSDGSLTSDEFTDIKQGLCAALMNVPRPAQQAIKESKYSDFHDWLKDQKPYAYQVVYGDLDVSEEEVIDAKATIMDMSMGWKAAIQSDVQPVIPIGLVQAINRLLDNDGSRGCFDALEQHRAKTELERLLAAAQQNEPQNIPENIPTIQLDPHVYRELVNELRDVALEYHSAQQLRERISRALSKAVTAAHPHLEQPVSKPYKLKDAVEDIRNSGVEIDADKIKAERDALNSPVIPDGWKLVPIEPTAEMAQAARDCHEGESFLPYSIYRAMLAAAPAQESE